MENKLYELIHRYDVLDKTTLSLHYIDERLTDREIGLLYGCSKKVVWEKRKKFNIPNRFAGKSNSNASKNRKFSITAEDAQKYSDQNLTYEQIANHLGCSSIVVKRRYKELCLTSSQIHLPKFHFSQEIISDEQKEVIIGTLMGDSQITASGAISCVHSIKQVEYLLHKKSLIANICNDKIWKTKGTAPNGKDTEGRVFTSGTHPYLVGLRKIFYPNCQKIVPLEFLKNHLTPRALAYWYQDDGSITTSGSARFHTEGFTIEDHFKIQNIFAELFDFDVRLHKVKGGYGVNCCFTRESSLKLFDLIRPHIQPYFRYKLGGGGG